MDEQRLIDANRLLDVVNEMSSEKADWYLENVRTYHGRPRPTFGDGIQFARDMIDNAPTVATAKRGHWIMHPSG